MKIFKKVIIFIAIIILVNSIIYIYPMNIINNIYTTEQNNLTGNPDVNLIYGRLSTIVNASIDAEYKRDAISIYAQGQYLRDDQRHEFYKILVYAEILISTVIAILGFVIRRKSVAHKYIGAAFITSSMVSILLLIFFYYVTYMTLR